MNQEFGFTLIELLVVIAVVGILIGVAVVSLDPLERINSAKDSRAQANVFKVSYALEACLTKNNLDLASCDEVSELEAGYLVSVPAGVSVLPGCVEQEGRSGTVWYFAHSEGVVKFNTTGGC